MLANIRHQSVLTCQKPLPADRLCHRWDCTSSLPHADWHRGTVYPDCMKYSCLQMWL